MSNKKRKTNDAIESQNRINKWQRIEDANNRYNQEVIKSYELRKEHFRDGTIPKQGRSAETRRRVAAERAMQAIQSALSVRDDFYACQACNSPNLVLDERAAGVFCSDCGRVSEEGMVDMEVHGPGLGMPDPRKIPNRYDRCVHFDQMMSSAEGRGPFVEKEDVDRIRDWLGDHPDERGMDFDHVGRKAIKAAISALGLNPRISNQWVQIHIRFPEIWQKGKDCVDDHRLRLSGNVKMNVRLRFKFLSKAFDDTLRKSRIGDALKHVEPKAPRENMLNLAYVIVQLIRIEAGEEDFARCLRFFMTDALAQRELNNTRWEILMNYCKKNFSGVITDDNVSYGHEFRLDWEYKPITLQDLLDHASFYN